MVKFEEKWTIRGYRKFFSEMSEEKFYIDYEVTFYQNHDGKLRVERKRVQKSTYVM